MTGRRPAGRGGAADRIAGETFRWFRRDRGWTQRDLARHLKRVAPDLGVDPTGISKLETGRRSFTWPLMNAFFVTLGIDLQMFSRRYAVLEAELKGRPVLVGQELEQAVKQKTQAALDRLLYEGGNGDED